MTVKLLIEHHLTFLSLKVGCTGSSESTLVKIPHRWKPSVTAQFVRAHTRQLALFKRACCNNTMRAAYTLAKQARLRLRRLARSMRNNGQYFMTWFVHVS